MRSSSPLRSSTYLERALSSKVTNVFPLEKWRNNIGFSHLPQCKNSYKVSLNITYTYISNIISRAHKIITSGSLMLCIIVGSQKLSKTLKLALYQKHNIQRCLILSWFQTTPIYFLCDKERESFPAAGLPIPYSNPLPSAP